MQSHQRAAIVTLAIIGLFWLLLFGGLATRMNLLLYYQSIPSLPPGWEVIGAPLSALGLGCLFVIMLLALSYYQNEAKKIYYAAGFLLAGAALPLLGYVVRIFQLAPSLWREPAFIELIWFAGLSGLSLMPLLNRGDFLSKNNPAAIPKPSNKQIFSRAVAPLLLLSLCSALAFYWTKQAQWAFDDFRLGFNDFGHFTWRLANSWNGRGLLVESPALPRFWDHFNPGLLLLVPLWGLTKTPLAIFIGHAVTLAFSSLLVFAISRKLGLGIGSALLWGIVWLVHPSIGLWNLAFSYHWHPVTLGLPFFLGALCCLIDRRYFYASLLFVLAASMEEGWLVMGALVSWMFFLFDQDQLFPRIQRLEGALEVNKKSGVRFSFRAAIETAIKKRWPWLVVSLLIVVAFVLVYKLSGLEQFQTARFAKLGNNSIEIVSSPWRKPEVFFPQLFQSRNFLFTLGLLVPLGLPAVVAGWRWLLPTLLPLGVLWAWDHTPAASLAFHYATTLMPCFFLAAISGSLVSKYWRNEFAMSGGAVATALICSLFWGALPWSPSSLVETDGQAYGIEDLSLRRAGSSDGKWLHRQIVSLEPHEGRNVLATGRIAGHFLRANFLETVGQFRERRKQLQSLSSTGSEWEWFDTLVLDTRENFQQSSEWTTELRQQAIEAGFLVSAEEHGIVVLEKK